MSKKSKKCFESTHDSRSFQAINPATQEVLGNYERISDSDLEAQLTKTERAGQNWRRISLQERCDFLTKIAALIRKKKDKLALLATREMGKPIQQSRAELEKSAKVCEYYAEKAEAFLSSDTPFQGAEVSYQALGNLLAVMPWNFPYWQVFRVLAPNLAIGNTMILKHSSNVPGCSKAIEDLVREAGVPADVFTQIFLESSRIEKLVADSRVHAVTLTGSNRAGQSLAEIAGKHLKKSVLELGGSDPYVIFKDADIQMAAKACAESRLINTGQSCIAAKRFIAVKEIHDEFLEAFKAELFSKVQDSPEDEATDLGCLAQPSFVGDLDEQVEQSLSKGAQKFENPRTKKEGSFYPTLLLTRVRKGMRVYDEEVFGPVAALIEAENEEQAIELANDTPFGLGAALFSRDEQRAREIGRERIAAGSISINDFVRSDPRLPFGGIKASGYGRELGLLGIREFANIKSIRFS